MFDQMIPKPIRDFFQETGTLLIADKGTVIFHEGEGAESIYFIQSGLVQVSKETEQARELTIRVCSEGNVIGEGALFSSFIRHVTTAKALHKSTLFVVNQKLFEQHLVTHPELMLDYVKWVQIENSKQQSRLRDLLLHGKKGALYSTLIRLANTYGEIQPDTSIIIKVKLTNTDIANLCGTSRELINRMFAELRRQQIIQIQDSYMTILNLTFLKQEIACDNCPLAICRID